MVMGCELDVMRGGGGGMQGLTSEVSGVQDTQGRRESTVLNAISRSLWGWEWAMFVLIGSLTCLHVAFCMVVLFRFLVSRYNGHTPGVLDIVKLSRG